MYIYIYTYTNINIHMYICIYVYIYMYFLEASLDSPFFVERMLDWWGDRLECCGFGIYRDDR